MAGRRVFDQLAAHRRRNLGVREVPVANIVGSVGRSHEFDLAFRPRQRRTREHLAVVAAAGNGRAPPIVLYQVGSAYFVEDGNHRVALARWRRARTVRAVVVEIGAATLTPKASCTRLGFELDREPRHRQR